MGQSGGTSDAAVVATAGFVPERTGDGGNLAVEAARALAQAQRERKAGWQWPLFVVGLLVIPMIFGGWLVFEALRDPGFTPEKDYYKKALDWDAHTLQLAKNHELGWKVAVTPMPIEHGPWTLQLSDAKGGPLHGAQLSGKIGQLTRGQETTAVDGQEVAPGTYQLAWAAQRPGIHDVLLQFKRGSDTFTWQEHVEALR